MPGVKWWKRWLDGRHPIAAASVATGMAVLFVFGILAVVAEPVYLFGLAIFVASAALAMRLRAMRRKRRLRL
ncbi:hypothetical protein OG948_02915 [Embleya sp. NBC_00888]|uniref:hypothetical protein n=1 Tax=Embleya sp. NBC_00888 TaxID=2975960 RepID=UPI00386B55A8|nr:hypothetical protein OG948_02915 [Embleya sp. NBC_00888]